MFFPFLKQIQWFLQNLKTGISPKYRFFLLFLASDFAKYGKLPFLNALGVVARVPTGRRSREPKTSEAGSRTWSARCRLAQDPENRGIQELGHKPGQPGDGRPKMQRTKNFGSWIASRSTQYLAKFEAPKKKLRKKRYFCEIPVFIFCENHWIC